MTLHFVRHFRAPRAATPQQRAMAKEKKEKKVRVRLPSVRLRARGGGGRGRPGALGRRRLKGPRSRRKSQFFSPYRISRRRTIEDAEGSRCAAAGDRGHAHGAAACRVQRCSADGTCVGWVGKSWWRWEGYLRDATRDAASCLPCLF